MYLTMNSDCKEYSKLIRSAVEGRDVFVVIKAFIFFMTLFFLTCKGSRFNIIFKYPII